ncbi:50S ribosomal protein L15 [Patescibacteria group bacterium]|nr:50S ribosomal protein L15 [Patescibacteria group bacterium]MBU1890349.1 50S ribosomal protein L15 [Patescibacteria group bacterium]
MELSLSNLKPKARKKRRRVGRGNASGKGTYSGRGLKGQKSRSGGSLRPGFEGGRMTLVQQLPKSRGFKSFKVKPAVINVSDLQASFNNNDVVTPAKLRSKGLIHKAGSLIKVLGEGKIEKKLTVTADAFSKSANDAITKAGGKIVLRKKK